MHAPPPVYRRPLGFLHDRRVRDEIARLDAERDCQRIVNLLAGCEFPFDITRALEVALFHTFGSQSVARLLDRTGEFRTRGQKRYDDTSLLIAHFLEQGWEGPLGRRAIARMNEIHAHYRIPNDDYLFVLWTFIDFPYEWMNEFGWRALSAHEQAAWYAFWVEIGRRMGIADIPASKADYDRFIAAYEAREMVPNSASQHVAEATLATMAGWFPAPLRPLVEPVVRCLVRPQFARAAGFAPPQPWLRRSVRGALKLRAAAKAFVSIERYAKPIAELEWRTYPGGRYELDALGPFTRRAARQAR
ncbi:MAG TPA: oxygenase MpaB family protein [Polyangiales bacterium]|nr:oxygenase MpaB family protein [Polyangiales bacterium]